MIHDVNTRTFFPQTGMLRSQRAGRLREERAEHMVVARSSLFWAWPIDGENINYMQAHVVPELELQIVKFGWKPHVAPWDKIDYYIDIITLETSAERWHLRDLYLDVTVVEGQRSSVLDTDEYLAALAAGYLTPQEAAFALTRTHDLLNALAGHGYSMEAYLGAQSVTLEWM